jgi:hypothetical protein
MINTNTKKQVESQHDIYDHYWDFAQFMGQFALDADFDKFDEIETIKEYNCASEEGCEFYIKVKSQADKLMNMEPFPIDPISYSAGGLNTTKQWLINVLELLEQRVTGKL